MKQFPLGLHIELKYLDKEQEDKDVEVATVTAWLRFLTPVAVASRVKYGIIPKSYGHIYAQKVSEMFND